MTISLGSMALFAELPPEAHAEVLAALHPRRYPAGTIIFNQGDPGDELLIVEDGEIAIFAPTTGPAVGQAIRIFKPGDVLGEMALIDQQPRSLSARAESDAAVLALGTSGIPLLLVPDSLSMARDAAARGWLDAAAVHEFEADQGKTPLGAATA